MRHLLFTVILLFTLLSTHFGQPRLSVSKTEALIGDQISLTLNLPGIEESNWINSDVIPADSVASIHLLGTSAISMNESGDGLSKTWKVAVYDTGVVRIPPVPIITRSGSGIDTQYSNDIPLQISGVADSLGVAPIKPIIYEEARFSDYLPYIIGFVVLVGLGVLAWWWSGRPKKEEKIIEVRRVIPPHEIALEALKELKAKELWQKGKIKEFHSELSHILRGYLERRYDVSALESTTSELRTMLAVVLTEEEYAQIMQMLQMEDLVKFAKAEPPIELHAEYMDYVVRFVRNTKIELTPEDDA